MRGVQDEKMMRSFKMLMMIWFTSLTSWTRGAHHQDHHQNPNIQGWVETHFIHDTTDCLLPLNSANKKWWWGSRGRWWGRKTSSDSAVFDHHLHLNYYAISDPMDACAEDDPNDDPAWASGLTLGLLIMGAEDPQVIPFIPDTRQRQQIMLIALTRPTHAIILIHDSRSSHSPLDSSREF